MEPLSAQPADRRRRRGGPPSPEGRRAGPMSPAKVETIVSATPAEKQAPPPDNLPAAPPPPPPGLILAVGTLDTKGAELEYVADAVRRTGARCALVDVGTKGPPTVTPGVTREVVAACHPNGADAVLGCADRGEAVRQMSVALTAYVRRELANVAGVIGAGGSGGTALIAPAMQALAMCHAILCCAMLCYDMM